MISKLGNGNHMKNTKTYAILAIAPLLLAGFGMQNSFAVQNEAYSAAAVAKALDSVSPYVTIDDKKFGELDVKEAKANGVSEEDLKIAKEYLRIQNKLIKNIHDNPDKYMDVEDPEEAKFKKYHEQARKIGNGNISDEHFLNFLLPVADALGCQTSNHPDSTTTYEDTFSTRNAAVLGLPGGYYPVPEYASNEEHHGNDYADWVVAYGCADGVFRNQIVLHDQGSYWQHVHEENPSEPNPQVLEYLWPTWDWGWYVEEWHDNN
jgi:hypothetical protein